LKSVVTIIDLHQNYDYYEYWSSNKWLVQEILAMINEVDKDIIIDGIINIPRIVWKKVILDLRLIIDFRL